MIKIYPNRRDIFQNQLWKKWKTLLKILMQLLLKIIIVCKDKGQKQDENTVGSTVIQKESSLVVSRRLKLSEIFVMFVFVLENYDGLKAFISFST